MVSYGLGAERSFSKTRFRAVTTVVAVALSLLVVRLYVLQVRRHVEFRQKSESNFIQLRRVPHERGILKDRTGRILVDNRPAHDVTLTPSFLPDARANLARILRRAGIPADAKEMSDALSDAVAQEQPSPILVARHVSADARSVVESELSELRQGGLETSPDGTGAYDLWLHPLEFPSRSLIYRRLRELLELSDEQMDDLTREVAKARGLNRFVPLVVRQNLTWEAYARISHAASLGGLPGVDVVESVTRHYLEGVTASHVLGYMNEVSPQELEQLSAQGYQRGDNLGRRGLERSYERMLRGRDGQEKVVVDAKGRRINDIRADGLLGEERRVAPVAGESLVLTLDMDLQHAAEQAFRGQAGAVVAVEVATGSILVLASFPSYDANVVSGRMTPDQKRALDMDPLQPWINKAIQQHYAPGSTFKIFTAIAGLLEGRITPDSALPCPGFFSLGRTTWRCFNRFGHGPISLRKSIQVSCDSYYYRLGYQLGADLLAQHVRSFGMGRRTGIPLDGETPGIIADEAYYVSRFGSYQGGYVVNNSIGQGDVAVTPLQLAMAYAAVVNGGILFEPRLLLRTEDPAGRPIRHIKPVERARIKLPERGMPELMAGMGDVVKAGGTAAGVAYQDNPPGLGLWLRTSGVSIAGKTGTAQVVRLSKNVMHVDASKVDYLSRDHAWFAGFAPLEAPEIVVVTLTEHGGFGGAMSAPVSAAVMKAYFEKKGIKARPERLPALVDAPAPVPQLHEDAGD